ncbi:AraC family transcriptional regulator [Persicobacter psychrovividus]|uniref:AraC family transcriptional regulator n=1 Tax=Persicobacter psychrovividus TaxID=387638 RepID=A0ABM7VMG1_9BACT|nr:AraC family transcriptional regulator [Persicobacter psychrovividus]
MNIFPEITPISDQELFVLLHHEQATFDYPVHSHKEYELSIICNSEGTRYVGDAIQSYSTFDVVLLGPNILHRWVPTDEKAPNVTVTTLQFQEDLFDSHIFNPHAFTQFLELKQNAKKGIHYQGESARKIKQLVQEIQQEVDFFRVIKFIELCNILAISVEYDLLLSEGYKANVDFMKSRRITASYEYIMQHSHRPISIHEVASQCNMSESAFSHFFKKCTNKSFTQFLLDIRLGRVYQYLIETNRSVSEICYDCGFNNLSNFNRAFKKAKGMTPLAFRKKYNSLD